MKPAKKKSGISCLLWWRPLFNTANKDCFPSLRESLWRDLYIQDDIWKYFTKKRGLASLMASEMLCVCSCSGQMACDPLPSGCSMPCFSLPDIHRGDVAAACSSPQGMFWSVLFPCIPFLHSHSRFLPSVTSGIFQGVELPFKSFASPLAKAAGFPWLLWSLWATAEMQHGSDPEQQAACAGSMCFLFALSPFFFLTHHIALKSRIFLSISGCLVKCQKYSCFRELVSFYVQKAKGREGEFCLC